MQIEQAVALATKMTLIESVRGWGLPEELEDIAILLLVKGKVDSANVKDTVLSIRNFQGEVIERKRRVAAAEETLRQEQEALDETLTAVHYECEHLRHLQDDDVEVEEVEEVAEVFEAKSDFNDAPGAQVETRHGRY